MQNEEKQRREQPANELEHLRHIIHQDVIPSNILIDVSHTNDLGKSTYTIKRKGAFYQLIYSLAGLILGLACVIGGIILFLNGVTGSTNWTAKFIGAESNISDAAPGVVLFIVGLFIVWVTRFNAKKLNQ